MNSESEIPVLQDLLFKGQSDTRNKETEYSVDENKDVEIEQDETNSESDNEQQIQHEELISAEEIPEQLSEELSDELPDDIDSSNQRQMIEEEIQQIMQTHMDKAYKQIKKLLKEKYS